MTLKELLNSLNYGEWILFRDTNDVPQRIEEYSDDWLYNSFIIDFLQIVLSSWLTSQGFEI